MPVNHDETKQLHIIHLSDLHFGDDHRFLAPVPPSGGPAPHQGVPTLLSKLMEDFNDPPELENVIVCLTGDFVSEAKNFVEFQRSEEFVRGLAQVSIHGAVRGLKNIYMIPGNHDVDYDKSTLEERWVPYAGFLSRIRQQQIDPKKPHDMVELFLRDDLGAAILCLNSEIYIAKDTADVFRGEVDHAQIQRVHALLSNVPKEYVKVALIHHHPILIPDLVEPDRNYDAVLNSGKLLKMLRDKGFHVVLHGHKHNPFVFSEDSQSAWTSSTQQPIVVVAGGSAGSTGIPDNYIHRCNCYNQITIKWHPAAGQSRVNVVTRGLNIFDQDGNEALPFKWSWRKLREYDFPFFAAECRPEVTDLECFEDDAILAEANGVRISEYKRLRGNMPVVEVLPSLITGQAYEARVWIVPRDPREVPVEVVWSAGLKFPAMRTTADQNRWFCASFNYWGAMLIQARITFADGAVEHTHIYARMPEDCS
jgi:predicted phosphodiesterase